MITAFEVVEDLKDRRRFLIREASALIKKGHGKGLIFKFRNELRKEGKKDCYYLPIMLALSDHIQIYYMLKEG